MTSKAIVGDLSTLFADVDMRIPDLAKRRLDLILNSLPTDPNNEVYGFFFDNVDSIDTESLCGVIKRLTDQYIIVAVRSRSGNYRQYIANGAISVGSNTQELTDIKRTFEGIVSDTTFNRLQHEHWAKVKEAQPRKDQQLEELAEELERKLLAYTATAIAFADQVDKLTYPTREKLPTNEELLEALDRCRQVIPIGKSLIEAGRKLNDYIDSRINPHKTVSITPDGNLVKAYHSIGSKISNCLYVPKIVTVDGYKSNNHEYLPHHLILEATEGVCEGARVYIDCGHIGFITSGVNSNALASFEQGVRLYRFLEDTGRQPYLFVLFNDILLYQIFQGMAKDREQKDAARIISRMREQQREMYRDSETTGFHAYFPREYKQILLDYGVDFARWKSRGSCGFEFKLVKEGAKIVRTLKDRFRDTQEITIDGQCISIDIGELPLTDLVHPDIPLDDIIKLTSDDTGKPLCPVIGATVLNNLRELGAQFIISIYPVPSDQRAIRPHLLAYSALGNTACHALFGVDAESRIGAINVTRRWPNYREIDRI